MKLRCFFFGHTPEGWATKRGVFGAGRCSRCHEAVGGIPIETPETLLQKPTAERKRVAPIWLKAVYETKRAAQR